MLSTIGHAGLSPVSLFASSEEASALVRFWFMAATSCASGGMKPGRPWFMCARQRGDAIWLDQGITSCRNTSK